MGETRWRGDNRNDPMADELVADPALSAALSAHRRNEYEEMQLAVGDAIQRTDGRKLRGWVAVAIWEDEDGNEGRSVLGDDRSTFLELKGYLHDGVWMAAHAD